MLWTCPTLPKSSSLGHATMFSTWLLLGLNRTYAYGQCFHEHSFSFAFGASSRMARVAAEKYCNKLRVLMSSGTEIFPSVWEFDRRRIFGNRRLPPGTFDIMQMLMARSGYRLILTWYYNIKGRYLYVDRLHKPTFQELVVTGIAHLY
jgi:hypothetical protein